MSRPTSTKGRLVDRLIRRGIALYVAHTNADAAAPGVSDALADALGLARRSPARPAAPEALDKIVVVRPADGCRSR